MSTLCINFASLKSSSSAWSAWHFFQVWYSINMDFFIFFLFHTTLNILETEMEHKWFWYQFFENLQFVLENEVWIMRKSSKKGDRSTNAMRLMTLRAATRTSQNQMMMKIFSLNKLIGRTHCTDHVWMFWSWRILKSHSVTRGKRADSFHSSPPEPNMERTWRVKSQRCGEMHIKQLRQNLCYHNYIKLGDK